MVTCSFLGLIVWSRGFSEASNSRIFRRLISSSLEARTPIRSRVLCKALTSERNRSTSDVVKRTLLLSLLGLSHFTLAF